MNREEAIAAARRVVTDTFVVTNTASFADDKEEQEEEIRLIEDPANEGEEPQLLDHRQLDVGVGGDAIWYVTLSFDSVVGDGNFRATARVTQDSAAVVDFEALP